MEQHFGSDWPTEEKVKHRDMVAPEARYIFVYEVPNLVSTNEKISKPSNECNCNVVGFVHYRFILEEELPVLYVYELQLEPHIQGKGLGKFLMQLLELIARKVCLPPLQAPYFILSYNEIAKIMTNKNLKSENLSSKIKNCSSIL